jgi:hypothetical protein
MNSLLPVITRSGVRLRSVVSISKAICLLVITLIPSGISAQQRGGASQPESVPAVIVYMYPKAFYPRSIETTNRKFMLVVANRDGTQLIDLSVTSIDPNGRTNSQIRRQQVRQKSKHWVTLLSLPPGQYRLLDHGPAARMLDLTVR